jgi:hypothetical protein
MAAGDALPVMRCSFRRWIYCRCRRVWRAYSRSCAFRVYLCDLRA